MSHDHDTYSHDADAGADGTEPRLIDHLIELRARLASGEELAAERSRWNFELASERNWDPSPSCCACYALTEKGRGRLLRTAGR